MHQLQHKSTFFEKPNFGSRPSDASICIVIVEHHRSLLSVSLSIFNSVQPHLFLPTQTLVAWLMLTSRPTVAPFSGHAIDALRRRAGRTWRHCCACKYQHCMYVYCGLFQRYIYQLVAPHFRRVGTSDQGDLLERFEKYSHFFTVISRASAPL